MSTKHVGILAAVAVGLILLMLALETDDTGTTAGQRLLPGLEAAANQLGEVRIASAEERVTLLRTDGSWGIAERDGYPADIGQLRRLVLALAEARVVERKTANPDNYERLGVGDPAEGGDGERLVLRGDGAEFAVFLGDPERGDFRYARVAGEAQGVLIDRNPEVPAEPAAWLDGALTDLPADEVRRVTITHADGESVVIEKADAEQTDFTVKGIPEGRELQYDTIANGIGGALAGLAAEDVRPAPDAPGEADTVTVFETFDGGTVTVTVHEADGDGEPVSWVGITAEPDADGLNERTAGWEYRLPGFREDQLTRRWEDLLKAP
jgi:hypothetical protein